MDKAVVMDDVATSMGLPLIPDIKTEPKMEVYELESMPPNYNSLDKSNSLESEEKKHYLLVVKDDEQCIADRFLHVHLPSNEKEMGSIKTVSGFKEIFLEETKPLVTVEMSESINNSKQTLHDVTVEKGKIKKEELHQELDIKIEVLEPHETSSLDFTSEVSSVGELGLKDKVSMQVPHRKRTLKLSKSRSRFVLGLPKPVYLKTTQISRHIKRCVVKCCSNTSTTVPDKIFLTIPQFDTYRRILWEEALGVGSLGRSSANSVCEDHFNLETDAANWMQYKIMGVKILLKPDVIPYLYLKNRPERPLTSQLTASDRKRKKDFLLSLQK